MSTHLRHSRARKGFTLIELLVVIAIIAILAAILFPVFAKAREKARQASCASDLKQLGLAVTMYTQDSEEVYPYGWQFAAWGGDPGTNWIYQTQPYIKNLNVLGCPDDSIALSSAAAWPGVYISYGYNCYEQNAPDGNHGTIGNGNLWAYSAVAHSQQLSKITKPAESIFLAEKWAYDGLNNVTDRLQGKTDKGSGTISGQTCTQEFAQPDYGSTDTGGGIHLNCDETALLPDGTRNLSAAPYNNTYPYTVNGGVSTHNGPAPNGIGIFLFCDGHVKAMNPVLTDPDPRGLPAKNMWDTER